MRRQLYRGGGITHLRRQKYGLGDFVRKLIPNELADVAVKAAPFVAPFNARVAGLMRGIGRYDQRGSLSDALKQGLATTAFGAGTRYLGGAENIMGGGLRGGFTSPLSVDRTKAVKSLFEAKEVSEADNLKRAKSIENTPGFMQTATDATIGKVPGLRALPPMVKQKLLVGGAIAGASTLASLFKGEFRPQEEGESMEDYLAARKDVVGKQMRIYMDNYFKFDPEYSQLDDAGRNAFVARYNVAQGGRIGYQTGGISSLNTLAQNIAINKANQAAFNQMIRPAQIRAAKITPARITPSKITPIQPTPARITPAKITPSKITPIQTRPINITPSKITPTQISSLKKPIDAGVIPFDLVPFLLNMDGSSSPITEDPGYFGSKGFVIDGKRYFSEKEAIADMGVERYNMFMAKGGRVGLRFGTPEEGIKSLDAGAMDITYEGNEGPQAPMKMVGQGPILPSDEDPVNPFQPQPTGPVLPDKSMMAKSNSYIDYVRAATELGLKPIRIDEFESIITIMDVNEILKLTEQLNRTTRKATGGRINQLGGTGPAGLPGIPRQAPDGMEFDMRENGGFQGLGAKEGKDDVPAMLAKNEFVFTADAVRGAGGGDIELGAQRMYDTMKNLEKRVV